MTVRPYWKEEKRKLKKKTKQNNLREGKTFVGNLLLKFFFSLFSIEFCFNGWLAVRYVRFAVWAVILKP